MSVTDLCKWMERLISIGLGEAAVNIGNTGEPLRELDVHMQEDLSSCWVDLHE